MEILNDTPFVVETLPANGPGGKTVLTLIVKGTFEMHPNEPVSVAGEQIPVAFGDEFYDEKQGGSVKFESDMAPFKPRADIVLVGKAHAPGGRMVQTIDVSLKVGRVKKTIRVIGDRSWDCSGLLLPEGHSVPQPFKVMDLTYEKAFGGIDKEGGDYCRENLVGRGFIAKTSKKVTNRTLLPNLENPLQLIKSWKDHPQPAGFGFYGRAWMPRAGYLGTHDDKWRKTRSPQPPEDFRFDYYNGAHPHLQVEGYLLGNEEVELVNLTSEETLRFQLPGLLPTGTVLKSFEHIKEDPAMKEAPPSEEEVAFHLDTLCLIPDEHLFYQVWRGLCPIRDLTALEVKKVEIR